MRKFFCILISVISVFFIFTNGSYAGDKDNNKIPKAVINFANKNFDYMNNPKVHLIQQNNWNGYEVYHLMFDWCNCMVCPEPQYILYRHNKVRFANSKERTPIYFINKTKISQKPPTTSITELWNMYCKNK